MTCAELAAESARTLAEWCDKPHAGYGARIHGDRLHVWYGRGVSSLCDGPAIGVSSAIPMAQLGFFWRNRVADRLRMLRRSLLED